VGQCHCREEEVGRIRITYSVQCRIVGEEDALIFAYSSAYRLSPTRNGPVSAISPSSRSLSPSTGVPLGGAVPYKNR